MSKGVHERQRKPHVEVELDRNGLIQSGLVLTIRANRQGFPLGSFSVKVPVAKNKGRYYLDFSSVKSEDCFAGEHGSKRREVLAQLETSEIIQGFIEEAVVFEQFPTRKDRVFVGVDNKYRKRESRIMEGDRGCNLYRRACYPPEE